MGIHIISKIPQDIHNYNFNVKHLLSTTTTFKTSSLSSQKDAACKIHVGFGTALPHVYIMSLQRAPPFDIVSNLAPLLKQRPIGFFLLSRRIDFFPFFFDVLWHFFGKKICMRKYRNLDPVSTLLEIYTLKKGLFVLF